MRTPEQEDSWELHIVRDTIVTNQQGHFVYYLFRAFENADAVNFEALRPVIQYTIRKYEFECTCDAEMRVQIPPEKVFK